MALATTESPKIMEINQFHKLLGHPNIVKCKQMAKSMDAKLTEKIEECESCGLGKAKKKKISKIGNKTANNQWKESKLI